MTHLTQDKAYLKKLQLYIIFVERPVSSLILSTGLYFLLKNGGKTMADVMVKILMNGAKAIGKTAVIRTDKFFGIDIKIAHLYGFQGSWNVIPRMLAKIIDGIPI